MPGAHDKMIRMTQIFAFPDQLPNHAGVAGVYDIETHYQYEYGRGVAELSTMKRAMGGRRKFQSQSPALILNAASGGRAKLRVLDQANGEPAVETTLSRRYREAWRVFQVQVLKLPVVIHDTVCGGEVQVGLPDQATVKIVNHHSPQ